MKPILATLFVFVLCGAAAAQNDSKVKQIKARLSAQKMTVDFDGLPLEDALSVFRSATGLNIIMDPAARAEHAADPITLKLNRLSVRSILKIMLGDQDLTIILREGVLVVVAECRMNEGVVTRCYDVKDLTYPIRCRWRLAPKMELIPPDEGRAGIMFDLWEPTEEECPSHMDEDFLVELIQSSTGRGKWDEVEAAEIRFVNHLLVVNQTVRVHHEIAELLRTLRRFE